MLRSVILETKMMSVLIWSQSSPMKHFPSVQLTVAELSLAPSSYSVEEGDMQMYLLGKNTAPDRGRHSFSKSQQQRQGDGNIQFELKLGAKDMHLSTYYLWD